MSDPSIESSADDDRRRMLFDYIRLGGAQCPSCRYALDGLVEPRCPECGDELALAVRGETARLKAWIWGLAAWAMAFGLYDVFLGLTVVTGNAPPARFWSFPLFAIFSLVGFIAWFAGRRRFMRLEARTRTTLALLSVVAVVSMMLVTCAQF